MPVFLWEERARSRQLPRSLSLIPAPHVGCRAVRGALRPGRTKLLMLESPTNPRMQVCDIAALSAAAHEVSLWSHALHAASAVKRYQAALSNRLLGLPWSLRVLPRARSTVVCGAQNSRWEGRMQWRLGALEPSASEHGSSQPMLDAGAMVLHRVP